MKPCYFIFILSLLLQSLAIAAPATIADKLDFDAEITACVERVLPKKSLTQTITLRVFEADALVSESKADLYWMRFDGEGSRAVIRFTEPQQRNGLALLAIEPADTRTEPEMTAYLPELRTTRRIGGKALGGSMFGTNLSFEDFAELQGLSKGVERQRLGDEKLEERDNYVFETRPGNPASSYVRVKTYVDKQWCIPVASYFYTRHETIAKTFIVDPAMVRLVDERWIPHHVRVDDLARNAHTEVVVDKVAVDPEIKTLIFTRGGLERGR